jgi:hypothetical protein
MRTLLVSVTVLIVGLGSTALAAERVRPPGAAAPSRTAHGPVALTESECKTLGGEVQGEPACAGGKRCITVDQYGVSHKVCINEK